MSRTARLVFMGSPEFALPSLEALAGAQIYALSLPSRHAARAEA
ncbi:MAG: hypothetical protein VXX49_05885 [Pseudomonadota bacterium]|nr:hypothetical protein [Pseudomonadota bacterium]